MKTTVLTRIAGAVLLAVLVMPAQIIAQEEHEHKREHFSQYRVKDLGTLGGNFSQAFGINNRGHVGGGASLPNGTLLPLDQAHRYAGPRYVGRTKQRRERA